MRNHKILFTIEKTGSEYEGTSWIETFQMLECLGCDAVCFRKKTWFSEWDYYDYGIIDGVYTGTQLVPGIKEEYFPPAVTRNLPVWEGKLPRAIRILLSETYMALHADSRRLAMMGARAIADMAIVEVIGDQGTFKNKLNQLVEKEYLSGKNQEYLEIALDAGNAASHRGHEVSVSEANTVMDIIENLLQSLFTLSSEAGDLRMRIPPRPNQMCKNT